MPNDWAGTVVVLLSTYWLHAALLLSVTWIVLRLVRQPSPALSESLWKLAAVLPLVTASAQWLGGFSGLSVELSRETHRDAEPETAAVTPSITKDRALPPTPPTRPPRPADPQPWRELTFPENDANAEDENRLPTSDIPREIVSDRQYAWSPRPHASDAQPMQLSNDSKRPELIDEPQNSPSPVERQSPGRTTARSVLCGAICGLALLTFGGMRLLVQTCVFHRRLADARVLEAGGLRQELDAMLRNANIRRSVQLLSSATFAEPIAFGLWRQRIVLPAGIEHNLRQDELRALLAHELAHLSRGDAAWLWVGRILCSCFAFQPWNFIARRNWQRAAEQQCDDWAVAYGVSAVALARCLTHIAEWRLTRRSPTVPALTFGGEPSTLARRVERLLNSGPASPPRKARIRRQVLTMATPAVAFALVWFGPRTAVTAFPQAPVERPHHNPLKEQTPTALAETRTEMPMTTTTDEFERLDAELDRLEWQMVHLHHLLDSASNAPEVDQMADRLHRRFAALKRSRQALEAARHTSQTLPVE